MPSMGTQASPGPKRQMGGCSSRSMGRQPAVVPRDVAEWHHDRALDVTVWREKSQTRRYGMILCHSTPPSGTTAVHSTSPSGMVVGFAHLWYWNVRVLPSGKVSTKLPSPCLVQLPDAASELPWKLPALRDSAITAVVPLS